MCSNQEVINQFGYADLWCPSTSTNAKASNVLGNKLILLYFSAHWCGPCKRFTPVLIDLYKTLKQQSKVDFELVYCSMDRTNGEYEAYTREMPWWCLKRGAPETQALARTYGAQGIPHLVVLDEAGRVLVADGVGEVSMDPHGKDFPWRPRPISELWPANLFQNCGKSVLNSASLDNKYLMLYFSAHWCPPCKAFTPLLNMAYTKLKAMRQDFELVFVSKDDTVGDFYDYYKEMAFCALPFQERDAMAGLFKLYNVRALPTLIMLSPMQGGDRRLINSDLVNIMQHTDYISDFPYHPKPYGDLTTTTDDINTTKCLIVFCELCDDEEQEDVVEAIKMAAENYKPTCSTGSAVKFYWALQRKGLATNVRSATKLPQASQEPLMILLDIPDRGAYYVSTENDITIDSILEFVRSPGQRRETA